MKDWALHCVGCGLPLGLHATTNETLRPGAITSGPDHHRCESCGVRYQCLTGIWSMLRPVDREPIERFLEDYTHIRVAEGRGSEDPEHYRTLPRTAPDDPLAWQWAIRAKSWTHARRQLFGGPAGRLLRRRASSEAPSPLRIIDLGAGVGWLSNHLALEGHTVVAVDLSLDRLDGLGAARHYQSGFALVQAHFDHLPFAGACADLVIFNASFHYSVRYTTTVAEALRVLSPGGRLVVLDSPIYRHDRSGRQMVQERHADFERRFGRRSDSVPSQQYLTAEVLDQLGRTFDLRWERSRAFYGWRWAARPLAAKLRGRREPSRFELVVGCR